MINNKIAPCIIFSHKSHAILLGEVLILITNIFQRCFFFIDNPSFSLIILQDLHKSSKTLAFGLNKDPAMILKDLIKSC